MINILTRNFEQKIRESSRGTETRVNIHFPIRKEANQLCIKINHDISKISTTEIDFSPFSFHVPHLTLYMGFIDSEKNFLQVMNLLHEFSQNFKSIKFSMSQPYLKRPESNYVFSDTNCPISIINIKAQIKELLGNNIKALTWDVVNENPHITLAHITKDQEKVEEYLSTIKFPYEIDASALEISFCGEKGTCIGSIRTFELQ